MKRRPKMKVLLEFDPPTGASFADIRDFITDWLESGGGNRHPNDPLFHSLSNVRVSKPIAPWRDPTRKAQPPAKIVKLNNE
jgi:hypothetical protein